MRLRYAPEARQDIRAILAHIRKESPQGATRVGQRIADVARLVADQPGAGTMTDSPPMRRMPIRPFPYVLFFEPHGSDIVIVGVRHGARDPETMPDNR